MKSKKKRDYIKILKISIIVVVILGIVSIILGNYKDYTEVKLRKNNKTIFSIADLKVDDLKYGDMEKEVKKKIGKPEKEKKIKTVPKENLFLGRINPKIMIKKLICIPEMSL